MLNTRKLDTKLYIMHRNLEQVKLICRERKHITTFLGTGVGEGRQKHLEEMNCPLS
jgi:hypothetical protein